MNFQGCLSVYCNVSLISPVFNFAIIFNCSSAGMTSGINAKDSLINDVIDDWQTRGVGVSKDNVVEANYMIQASRTVKGHF